MNQYFEQMVLSASPAELIRLLYQKAIASTRSARAYMNDKSVAGRCSAINNAYLVIDELALSLRPEEAPELANRLSSLYAYMQKRLLEANATRSEAPLTDVLGLLITLAEAWNVLTDTQGAPSGPWAAACVTSEEMDRAGVSA